MRRDRSSSTRPSVVYPAPPLTEELEIDLPPGANWGLCLSHDIDHLGLREHLVDGFLPRYVFGVLRQNLAHRFRPLAALDALGGIALAAAGNDRWDSLGALLEAERRAGVRSTWFIAVRNGLGISYCPDGARRAVGMLREAGVQVGLHGQAHESAEKLAGEVQELSAWCGAKIEGLRMHYLRLTAPVLEGADRARLQFDSTVMERGRMGPDELPLSGPRLVRPKLFEIPLHVMDSTLFSATGLGLDRDGGLDYVRRLARRAAERHKVLVVNLHSNCYSRQSPQIRDWYDGLLAEATSRSDVFLTDFAGLLPRIRRP